MSIQYLLAGADIGFYIEGLLLGLMIAVWWNIKRHPGVFRSTNGLEKYGYPVCILFIVILFVQVVLGLTNSSTFAGVLNSALIVCSGITWVRVTPQNQKRRWRLAFMVSVMVMMAIIVINRVNVWVFDYTPML